MSILRGVFEGRCHQVVQITIQNAPRQRDRVKGDFKAPLINTVRTPTCKACLGNHTFCYPNGGGSKLRTPHGTDYRSSCVISEPLLFLYKNHPTCLLPDDSAALSYPKWLPDSSSASEAPWLPGVQDAWSSNFEHCLALGAKVGKMDSRSSDFCFWI